MTSASSPPRAVPAVTIRLLLALEIERAENLRLELPDLFAELDRLCEREGRVAIAVTRIESGSRGETLCQALGKPREVAEAQVGGWRRFRHAHSAI